jgi:hypothetical protein
MASRRALWKAGAWRVRRLSRASELSGPTPDRESRCKRRAKPREQRRKPHALNDPASAESIPTPDRTSAPTLKGPGARHGYQPLQQSAPGRRCPAAGRRSRVGRGDQGPHLRRVRA